MINTGDFEKHLKKIRSYYARKHIRFTDIIRDELSYYGEIKGELAGLYVLFYLHEQYNAEKTAEACRMNGILLDWLGKFYQGGRHIPGNALILGFRGMPVESMESGILGIKDVIAQAH